jgi:serine/threonine protein kinase
VTHDGDSPSSTGDADSFLRAVAASPDKPVVEVPARVAHFRILGVLGRGGMGVVYRAEDETLRRVVALKVLPDASGDEERRQRFLREARSAAAVTHANVAVVHQVGDAECLRARGVDPLVRGGRGPRPGARRSPPKATLPELARNCLPSSATGEREASVRHG